MTKRDEEGPTSHIPLHPLEFQVLMVLLEGELHGYGIAKEIEGRDPGIPTILPTNLYRRLRSMAESGMISESADEEGGQKRYFQMTPYGEEVARAEAKRLEALVDSARLHSLLPIRDREA
jgi:DNA-binding PadR family transcriptional regulator